jgi:hypothetical protein
VLVLSIVAVLLACKESSESSTTSDEKPGSPAAPGKSGQSAGDERAIPVASARNQERGRLVDSLESPDPAVRKTAVLSLGQALQRDLPATLRNELVSTRVDEVRRATRQMDTSFAKERSGLVKALGDGDVDVRRAAATVIGQLSPLFLTLVLQQARDPRESDAAMEALVASGSVDHVLAALRERCQESLWADSTNPAYRQQFLQTRGSYLFASTLLQLGQRSSALRTRVIEALWPELGSQGGLGLIATWVIFKLEPGARACTDPAIALVIAHTDLSSAPVTVLSKASAHLRQCRREVTVGGLSRYSRMTANRP